MRFLASLVLYVAWLAWSTAHSEATNATGLQTHASSGYLAVAYFVNWVSAYPRKSESHMRVGLTGCAGRQPGTYIHVKILIRSPKVL